MSVTEKVTLALPIDVMESVRTLSPPRRQSQFIAEAIRSFVVEQQRKSLRERLIAGYQANAVTDIAIAAEWLPLEEEIFDNNLRGYESEE